MRKHLLAVAIATELLLSSTAWGADDAGGILKEAKTVLDEAVSLEGGWTSTQDLIKESEQQLQSGAKDQALKLAKQALAEAKLSLERARELNKNWSVPKYLTK